MHRFAIVLLAALIGIAAPAKAWCEANCLAPAQHASEKSHCSAHEPSSDTPSMSAAEGGDCPVLDSARPLPSSLVGAPAQSASLPIVAPVRTGAVAANRPGTGAPKHPLHTPLRI